MMTKETKAEQLKLIAYIIEQDLLWEYLPDDEDVWHFGHFEADLMTCFNRGWEIRLKNPKKTEQVDNIYLKAFKEGKRVQWLVPHKNEWVDYDKMVWCDEQGCCDGDFESVIEIMEYIDSHWKEAK